MYEKRLCILKQLKKGFSADGGPLTGAVYAERLGSELTLTPRIAGLSPLSEGRYALAVWVGGNTYCVELEGNDPLRISGVPSLEGGFSALLCFMKGGVEPIAYGVCGGAPEDPAPILAALERPLNAEAALSAPEEPPGEPPAYNDEAIADSNYYAPEKEAEHPFKRSRGLSYYHEIEHKIAEAFKKYPKDGRLKRTFPHSEWVNAGGPLLGIIYEEGIPRLLCVAMEEEPPEQAREASIFVPLSPYSDEEGLYVVFQDADTGEYVRTERS